MQQQQLLDESEKHSLYALDEFFVKRDLLFNTFKWGSGSKRILITHGWGSKAADFSELISALREIPDTEIIAFDAPGNGSSEGELSNLELYVHAVAAIIKHYGKPDVMIGHSLGGITNVMAVAQTGVTPSLLISIAPLIRLREHFEASMSAAGVSPVSQQVYLKSFEEVVGVPASYYNQYDLYQFDERLNHLLIYDEHDVVSPYAYLQKFLATRPFIKTINHPGTGHERIIRLPEIINEIVDAIKSVL